MNRDLQRYLNLLNLKPKPPTLAALAEITSAHLQAIPFENISKIYYYLKTGHTDFPGLEQYLDGIENNNFGGTCYSNNFYLHELLKGLGYDVSLCGADMNDPDVHLVNIVDFRDRSFLVDVGYAAPFFDPIPLDLTNEYKLKLGTDEYMLLPKNRSGNHELKLIRNGEQIHGYLVKPYPRKIQEFDQVIKNSFRPGAPFLNAVLAVKFAKNSYIRIDNFSVISWNGANSKKKKLNNTAELVLEINRIFAIPEAITTFCINSVISFTDTWG